MTDFEYGKRTTVEKVAEGKVVSTESIQTPSIKVVTSESPLTEYLKLLDKYKRGLIGDFGITCHVDRKTNSVYRIEPWFAELKEMS